MLAAGVTDAATLEPPVPVPARRVEVARATRVALPVWLAAQGAAARPVVGALPVLPTAMRAADVRAAGVLAPAVAGAGSDVLAPAVGADRGAAGRAVRCGGGGGGHCGRAADVLEWCARSRVASSQAARGDG